MARKREGKMEKLNIKSVNELDPSKVYKIKVGETLCELRFDLNGLNSGFEYWIAGEHRFANHLIECGCEVFEEEPEPTVVVEFEWDGGLARVLSNGTFQCAGRYFPREWTDQINGALYDALISAFLKKIKELEARGEQS